MTITRISRRTRCLVLGLLVVLLPVSVEAAPRERGNDRPADLAAAERKKLEEEAAQLRAEGLDLYRKGQYAAAVQRLERAVAVLEKLYPAAQFPSGHSSLALNLIDLGTMLRAAGKYGEAQLPYERALTMCQKLYPEAEHPNGHPNLAGCLNNLGALMQAVGKYEKAALYYENALAMSQKLYPQAKYPEGHANLAGSLNNLATLMDNMGEYVRSLQYHERSLAMMRQLYPETKYPEGHPELARIVNNLGWTLLSLGEYHKVLGHFESALAMRRKLYPPDRFPRGHPDLIESLYSLGMLHQTLGEHGKALPYYEQVLTMSQKSYPESEYPNGHLHLAWVLNNLGQVLRALGDRDKALAYHERALVMLQALYPEKRFPEGHPSLATSFGNLGALLRIKGEYPKALSYHERALAMREKLYPPDRFPHGHPHLVESLGSLGVQLSEMGEYERAFSYLERALTMCQKLYPETRYPEGHPDLARGLHNLGFVLRDLGKFDRSLACLETARVISCKHTARVIAAAPEAEALAYIQTLLPTMDGYLTTALQLPQTEAASHRQVWDDKAMLMRLLQRRHEAIRVAGGLPADAQKKYERWIEVKRHINRLLVNPGRDLQYRDRRLAELTEENDQLERELAALLPELPRQQELARLGPLDLAGKLPAGTAFVDFIWYAHFEKGKAARTRYLAFILAAGRPVKRIELGDTGPIDEAISSWKQSIERREASQAPERLRSLVWDRIAKELPADTRTIYLSPDGALARLPFAALPGRKPGTVLLEDHVLALVPHGPWLLEQLIHPPKAADDLGRMLLVGGVRYDPPGVVLGKPYADLPASALEMRQVKALFPARAPIQLDGTTATTAAVKEQLPRVRCAHLATHGYFDAQALAEERRRQREQIVSRDFGREAGRQPIGQGMRNPLGYVGLALASANDSQKAGTDGGILTGLGIVDLPLEGLRLCVLSACETGLGTLTETSEGVIGLQRAFHVAGCPNVIGSLWNVNDTATAALMTRFYHELTVNRRPPLEALREAQLTIYHHPEYIPDLAGERGPPALEKAVKISSTRAEPTDPKVKPNRADTKLWAAFVLSGLGR